MIAGHFVNMSFLLAWKTLVGEPSTRVEKDADSTHVRFSLQKILSKPNFSNT